MNLLHLFHDFLALPAIITLPLVPPLPANGQTGDAVGLDATINYIVNQVNANAQPITTTPTALEWQPLGQTPTFISGTQFSVPGDLRTTLQTGRVLQTTNTSGLVYSIVTGTAFAVSTTVTVAPLFVGGTALDSGLSVVNFGILNALTPSSPAKSTAIVTYSHNTDALSSGVNSVLSTANGYIVGASGNLFGEFNSATGAFTPLRLGQYLVSLQAQLTSTGVTFSGASSCFVSTPAGGGLDSGFLNQIFAPAVAGTNKVVASCSGLVTVTSGLPSIAASVNATFSAGTPVFNQALLTIIGPL